MARRKRRPPRVRDNLRTDGELCVTFVNSASPKRRGFSTYEEVLDWCAAIGALTAESRSRLEAAAAERPAVAAGIARRARTVRGRLRRILVAVAAGGRPDPKDFGPFSTELLGVLAAQRLLPGAGRCVWSWTDDVEDDLDRVLWPILHSAAGLLASPRVAKLRECAIEDCDLLFLGGARGRPRKFCSEACGSRSTSAKHYRAKVRPKREKQRAIERGELKAGLANLGAPEETPPVDG